LVDFFKLCFEYSGGLYISDAPRVREGILFEG